MANIATRRRSWTMYDIRVWREGELIQFWRMRALRRATCARPATQTQSINNRGTD